jgi:hypothetical protein
MNFRPPVTGRRSVLYPTTPLTPGSNIGAPALTPGNWLVTIRYNGIYGTSADSNGIVITVP